MAAIAPMTMMDFFRKSAGVWMTQRSVHHFDCRADESGESNLYIELVAADRPEAIAICQQQGLDPAKSPGGASFNWQETLSDRPPNPNYAAILVDMPDDETGRTGKLLRDRGYVEGIPVVSRYAFADDGMLTIETDYDNNQGQERCWFVNDDFRVRVSTVRTAGGVNLMTYCSEFRCVLPETLKQMKQRNESLASSNGLS